MTDYSRQRKWNTNNLENITFSVYKGRKNDISNYAKEKGVSIGQLIKDAIESYTGIPVGTKKENNKAEEDNA